MSTNTGQFAQYEIVTTTNGDAFMVFGVDKEWVYGLGVTTDDPRLYALSPGNIDRWATPFDMERVTDQGRRLVAEFRGLPRLRFPGTLWRDGDGTITVATSTDMAAGRARIPIRDDVDGDVGAWLRSNCPNSAGRFYGGTWVTVDGRLGIVIEPGIEEARVMFADAVAGEAGVPTETLPVERMARATFFDLRGVIRRSDGPDVSQDFVQHAAALGLTTSGTRPRTMACTFDDDKAREPFLVLRENQGMLVLLPLGGEDVRTAPARDFWPLPQWIAGKFPADMWQGTHEGLRPRIEYGMMVTPYDGGLWVVVGTGGTASAPRPQDGDVLISDRVRDMFVPAAWLAPLPDDTILLGEDWRLEARAARNSRIAVAVVREAEAQEQKHEEWRRRFTGAAMDLAREHDWCGVAARFLEEQGLPVNRTRTFTVTVEFRVTAEVEEWTNIDRSADWVRSSITHQPDGESGITLEMDDDWSSADWEVENIEVDLDDDE